VLKFLFTGKRTLILIAVLAGVIVLYLLGSEKRREEGKDAAPTSETTQCRVEVVGDGLNVRSAPAIDPNNVVDQLGQGEEVDAGKTVQNGFRQLANGRWVSADYVKPLAGRDCG
jgi:hypothetical protein